MNVLIIYAYPNHEGFCDAVCRSVTEGLTSGGTHFKLIDLYQENFNPALVFNRIKRRSEMKNDPETARYRQMITEADHLIFVYPTWWSGMPAILRGFFDRVLASGFAYTYSGLYPHGLLKKKAVTLIYTMDTPAFYARLFRRNIEWKAVKGPVFYFCGMRPVRRLVLYSVRRSTAKKRASFLAKVRRYCANL